MEKDFLFFLVITGLKFRLVIGVALAISIALVAYMMLLGGLHRLDKALGVEIKPEYDSWHSQRARYFSYGVKYLFRELNVPKSFSLHVLLWISGVTTVIVFTALLGGILYKYIEWSMGAVATFPHSLFNEIGTAIFYYGQLFFIVTIIVSVLVLPRDCGKKFIIQNFTNKTPEKVGGYDPFTGYDNMIKLWAIMRAQKKPYLSGTFCPKGLLPKVVLWFLIIFDIFLKVFAVGLLFFFGINYGVKIF